jgi:hypothetical protein
MTYKERAVAYPHMRMIPCGPVLTGSPGAVQKCEENSRALSAKKSEGGGGLQTKR